MFGLTVISVTTANRPGTFSMETENSKHTCFKPVKLLPTDYTGQQLGLC